MRKKRNLDTPADQIKAMIVTEDDIQRAYRWHFLREIDSEDIIDAVLLAILPGFH